MRDLTFMNDFEKKVYEVLKQKYRNQDSRREQWLIFPQVKVNTGHNLSYGGERYIDFFIVNLWPSTDYKCIAIEAKSNIQDLRQDLDDPKKQAAARFYSDQFFFLVTEELYIKYQKEIHRDIIAYNGDGLMVLKEKGIRVIIQSPKRKIKSPFSMGFICSLLRNASRL